MVDVIVSSSTNNNKNSILLLIRKDNVIEKKIYSKEKNFLGMDNRLRKANLCKRH